MRVGPRETCACLVQVYFKMQVYCSPWFQTFWTSRFCTIKPGHLKYAFLMKRRAHLTVLKDMIRLDGFRILESVITCSWVSQLTVCNETLKVKDIKIHLKRKHGVKSRLPSGCFWNECTKSKQMMLPSLARHIKERHTSSIWPCPTCDGVFTRDETLLRHFKGCKGPSMSG